MRLERAGIRGHQRQAMIGRTIGHYRLIDQLGRGGSGTVYRALDATLDREVAIKVLNPDLADADAMRRFQSEATILAKLNHPSIATVYELFHSEADLLMVMELVRGKTLERTSDELGPLPPDRAAPIIERILSALAQHPTASNNECQPDYAAGRSRLARFSFRQCPRSLIGLNRFAVRYFEGCV